MLSGTAFADDLVVMAEKWWIMRRLLDICFAEATKLVLRVNARKSACVEFFFSDLCA